MSYDFCLDPVCRQARRELLELAESVAIAAEQRAQAPDTAEVIVTFI